MPYLDRDGAKIFYEDNGTAGDSRTAILMTHGFGATSSMWQGQVDVFGGKFRMIRWDMRGHGKSEVPDDMSKFTQDLSVQDMAALLDHLGIEKAIIAGHSLGGFMSLRFHATYPDRVLGLILQGTGPGFRNAEAREKWNENARGRADKLESEGLDVLGGGAEVGDNEHKSGKSLANAARGMLTHIDAKVIDNMGNINVPTIIIIGEKDTNFIGAGEYMAKKIDGAMHFVIANAGHGCNIEQPAAVNKALADYLAQF